MAVLNRGVQYLWNDESTGEDGVSNYAIIGAQTNVAIHIEVDGPTTIRIEAAASMNRSVGGNYMPDGNDFAPYYSIYSSDSYFSSSPNPVDAIAAGVRRPLEFVLESAGKAAFDISPYTPKFLRLTSTNDVTATAVVEVVG